MNKAYVQFYDDSVKLRVTLGVGKHLTFFSVSSLMRWSDRHKKQLVVAGRPIMLSQEKEARRQAEERLREFAEKGGVA